MFHLVKVHLEYEVRVPSHMSLKEFLETPVDNVAELPSQFLGADAMYSEIPKWYTE